MSDNANTPETDAAHRAVICGGDAFSFPEHARSMERQRNEARAERDRYRDTLLSKHGGECIALLDELDAARAENARLRGIIARATRERLDKDYFIPAEDISASLDILREEQK